MATRVQSAIIGLSKAKQTNISTISASFLRFKKLNPDPVSTGFMTENDATEIGKGDEFISAAGVFPVAYNVGSRLDKYASAEFMIWAIAHGLGNVVESSGLYTITPINPATALELPYFSYVEQIPEGGGMAIDNAFIGCAIEDWEFTFSSGPGRAATKMTVNWIGSGKITNPSAVTVPAVLTENYMLAASMALTVNGVDYVGGKTILGGSIGWKNNLLTGAGFYPGSGLQNGAAIRGRLEIGARQPSAMITARLLATSTEYAKMIAQTTNTATLTITFDATHTITFTLQSVSFEAVENTESDGLLAVRVMIAPKSDPTNGVLTVTGKCGIIGIAQ